MVCALHAPKFQIYITYNVQLDKSYIFVATIRRQLSCWFMSIVFERKQLARPVDECVEADLDDGLVFTLDPRLLRQLQALQHQRRHRQ